MAFSLGSDPFASGLPQSTIAANAPTIFGYQLPTIPNPFDYLPNNPISGAIDTAATGIHSVSGFIGEVTNAEFWERAGLVILGLIFITVSLSMFGSHAAQMAIRQVTP